MSLSMVPCYHTNSNQNTVRINSMFKFSFRSFARNYKHATNGFTAFLKTLLVNFRRGKQTFCFFYLTILSNVTFMCKSSNFMLQRDLVIHSIPTTEFSKQNTI